MPSVDVVIPNYNYGRFLTECVASVFADGLPEVRAIIIDNASTDDSREIARRIAAGDPRVRLVEHRDNLGSHASFNEAIDLASADYLFILCADDLLLPGALAEGISALEQTPQASFAIGAHAHDNDLAAPERRGWRIVDGDRFIDGCCRSIGHNLTAQVIVRTHVQKSVGHYRSSLRYMDDLEMALRLARSGAAAELALPLVFARRHDKHMSSVFWDDRLSDLEERLAVFDSFFATEGATLRNAARRHRSVRRTIAETSYWSAVSHLLRGWPRRAARLFRFGVSLSPRAMILPPMGHILRTQGSFGRARAIVWQRR